MTTGIEQLEDFLKLQLRLAWKQVQEEALDMEEGLGKEEEEQEDGVINGFSIGRGLNQPDLSI